MASRAYVIADASTFQISAWLRVQGNQAFPPGNAPPGERFSRDLHLPIARRAPLGRVGPCIGRDRHWPRDAPVSQRIGVNALRQTIDAANGPPLRNSRITRHLNLEIFLAPVARTGSPHSAPMIDG